MAGELFAALDALRRSPARLASVAAVSFVIRVLTVAITHVLLLSVGADVRLFDTMTLWPAATLVGVLPITLAGVGARDASFIYLLHAESAGAAAPSVLAATMGYSLVAIVSFAVIGLPFMVRESLSE
jgi:uncharacterized membrane protein YbhN (UPF0104 family)